MRFEETTHTLVKVKVLEEVWIEGIFFTPKNGDVFTCRMFKIREKDYFEFIYRGQRISAKVFHECFEIEELFSYDLLSEWNDKLLTERPSKQLIVGYDETWYLEEYLEDETPYRTGLYICLAHSDTINKLELLKYPLNSLYCYTGKDDGHVGIIEEFEQISEESGKVDKWYSISVVGLEFKVMESQLILLDAECFDLDDAIYKLVRGVEKYLESYKLN